MRLSRQLIAVTVVLAGGVALWLALDWMAPDPSGGGRPGGFPTPVEAVAARTGTIDRSVVAVGSTLARESIDVVAEVPGRLRAILVEEGQQVEAGDVLFELDRRGEEADVRELEALVLEQRRRFERSLALLRDNSVSQATVDNDRTGLEAAEARLAAAQVRLDERAIRAPFAGMVGFRQVSNGAYVSPGTLLTTLDDLSALRLEFAVPERFLGDLRIGLEVGAQADGFEGRTFVGTVERIATRVDPVTRSVRVQSEIDNSDGSLRPGMFMIVRLVLGRDQTAVMVPEEALVPEADRVSVFRVVDGAVERILIETGVRVDGWVEVVRGLAEGDVVVTAGTQKLRDGAAVSIVTELLEEADRS